jgi:hypothetical protein
VLQAVEERAVAVVDEFNPQGLANVLWALASLNHQPHEHALATLSRGVGRLAPRFNAQNLANVVWAYATLQRVPDTAVLGALLAACPVRPPQGSRSRLPRSLCKHRAPSLALCRLTWRGPQARLRECEPQGISILLWGFARLRVDPGESIMGAFTEAMEVSEPHLGLLPL